MSFRAGRAGYSRWSSNWRPYRGWLSQLAVRSALRRLWRLGLPPAAALLSIPQPRRFAPLRRLRRL
ncbi:hypothetical protein SapgrDRAFT_1308 [Saprospira grandis DSM 2844]|uniref:Uncharacterized protein n=1 Tax=Saprospira grandis DSM 2844 TaxID=694433 RepID=J0XVH8_9BACT|nr:hypothetical protein SapgrDRAFT_1308 [Saprospira grandis DSM 2844]